MTHFITSVDEALVTIYAFVAFAWLIAILKAYRAQMEVKPIPNN